MDGDEICSVFVLLESADAASLDEESIVIELVALWLVSDVIRGGVITVWLLVL